jgi:galactonate dehydratase
MKIQDIKIFVADAAWRDWVFVKVYTDDGLTGVGEATLEWNSQAVVSKIQEMKSYFIGKDPTTIENHWKVMYNSGFWLGPIYFSAFSAIEQALWDITGKSLNVPVHKLLGGRCRDRCRAYGHIPEKLSNATIQQRVERTLELVAEGWTAFKWDPFPKNFLSLTREQIRDVIDQVEAVRVAVGEEIDLLIEVHGRLNPNTAIQVARELEPYHPYFFEEPVPPDSVDAMEKVAQASPIPIATGERVFTKWQFWPLLERQAVDYIQPDIIHCGGILETKKVAALAETRYVGVAPHNPNGPICTAATLHLIANLPNFAIQEMANDDYYVGAKWRDEVVVNPEVAKVKNGYLEVPQTPGLGVDINEKAIAKHPAKARAWGDWSHPEGYILD